MTKQKNMTQKINVNIISDEKVLSHLVCSSDTEFFDKVFHHLKPVYFDNDTSRAIYYTIRDYAIKHNTPPSLGDLKTLLDLRNDLNENVYHSSNDVIKSLKSAYTSDTNVDMLVSETEKFCRKKALYYATGTAAEVIGGTTVMESSQLLEHFNDAFSISFDDKVGDDYFADIESLWDELHAEDAKIPFGISILDKVTKGGLSRKSLSCIMASTGGGKTLSMCHVAAAAVLRGYNVLYITLEMSSAKIRERITANHFDMEIDSVGNLSKEEHIRLAHRIASKTKGKLYVKEYPTGSAHSGHFRHLLREFKLRNKLDFDLVVVDYLNICASNKMNDSSNSYAYVKTIAEELRSLAVEFDVAILTSTQVNRAGYNNKDLDITNTSQSIGLPETLDFFIGLYANEELQADGKFIVTQLKNRWGDLNQCRKFVIGVERAKMKLYDLNDDDTFDFDTPPENTKRPKFSDVKKHIFE